MGVVTCPCWIQCKSPGKTVKLSLLIGYSRNTGYNRCRYLASVIFVLGKWINCLYPDTLEINSLWPCDAMWRQRTGSTLAQVMACCLTAPSHYLNQCCLLMNLVLWHPPENNYIGISQNINSNNEFKNSNFKIITASPRGQWVKHLTFIKKLTNTFGYANPWKQ